MEPGVQGESSWPGLRLRFNLDLFHGLYHIPLAFARGHFGSVRFLSSRTGRTYLLKQSGQLLVLEAVEFRQDATIGVYRCTEESKIFRCLGHALCLAWVHYVCSLY